VRGFRALGTDDVSAQEIVSAIPDGQGETAQPVSWTSLELSRAQTIAHQQDLVQGMEGAVF
jgi:hypothetical protein